MCLFPDSKSQGQQKCERAKAHLLTFSNWCSIPDSLGKTHKCFLGTGTCPAPREILVKQFLLTLC